MGTVVGLVLSVALAANEPPASPLEKLERRVGILSGVGCAFAVAGAVTIGLGAGAGEPRYTYGGSALIGVGLHAIALAIVAWIWPDDRWLGLVTDQTRPAAARTWW